MGLLKTAEMSEGPRDAISVPFDISVTPHGGSKHVGYVAAYTWFLGYAEYHSRDLASFHNSSIS